MKSADSFHRYLSDAQYSHLRTVFMDLTSNIKGVWILTGSISYGFYIDIDYPAKLRDLDIVLVAKDGRSSKSIVQPSIKEKFFVIFIQEAVRGYYFGLRHKETGLWVDMFTPVHQPEFKEFDFAGQRIKVQTIEESYYTIIKGLLHRENDKLMVAEKWLNSARLLKNHIDLQKVDELLLENQEEYEHLLPKTFAFNPEAIRDYALNSGVESGYNSTSSEYPEKNIITENGISIEEKEEWLGSV